MMLTVYSHSWEKYYNRYAMTKGLRSSGFVFRVLYNNFKKVHKTNSRRTMIIYTHWETITWFAREITGLDSVPKPYKELT